MKSHTQQLGPLQISEIVLHTSQYETLKAWYMRLFGGIEPALETDCNGQFTSAPHVKRLCFLRVHSGFPVTQTLGIFEASGVQPASGLTTGLDHMQFRELSLESLFARYETLKSDRLTPFQAYNHGPGTSFYYHDPDGNVVEVSAPNFESQEEYLAFFKSEEFRKNVEGHAIDPEAYIRERRAQRMARELA